MFLKPYVKFNLRNFSHLSFFYVKQDSRDMTTRNLQASSDDEKKKMINSFDNVLCDCDGVLWLAGRPLPGAPEVINNFKQMGKKIFFITNNSTLTRKDFSEKCKRLGFNVTEDELIGTSWLTAHYLKSTGFSKKVYLMGPKAVEKELQEVGIQSIGVGPDYVEPKVRRESFGNTNKTSQRSEIVLAEYAKTDEGVGAVVVGYDRHISLPKLVKAATYLANPETLFIGTNTDETYPHQGNFVWPGTGTFVRAVETCSGRNATIMGKPSTYIVDVLRETGVETSRCLMIGDRCNTDIYFGTRSGMITLLVMTGVTKESDLEYFKREGKHHLVPTYYTDSIADLLPLQAV